MADKVIIGYRHQDLSDVGGDCPCRDPGNYCTIEVNNLSVKIKCWCGRSKVGTLDNTKERDEFLARHGGRDG